jgi:hypothetical protein
MVHSQIICSMPHQCAFLVSPVTLHFSIAGVPAPISDPSRSDVAARSGAAAAGEANGRRRGRPRAANLTVSQVLAWADAHHVRTGNWPTLGSGSVADAPHENWSALNAALRIGVRGLPGGDSLARLLRREKRIGERRGRAPQFARQRLFSVLHAQGLCAAEIGRRLGVSRQAAWEMLRRNIAS